MVKYDLISLVADEVNMNKRTTGRVVDAVLAHFSEAMTGGEEITIAGFGTFGTKTMSPRIGRNPHTGESVGIPERVVPSFKPSPVLRERMKKPDTRSLCNSPAK